MKTSESTPSNIIQYIGEIIKERQNKSLPTFYTISIEQYEKTTPVAEKEEGYDNFKAQVLKYMSDYNLTALTVQLFSGKSRNVKSPFQTFKVPLKKQNPSVFLGNIEREPTTEVQQLESSIPVGRYYDEKFEMQMRIMRIEMEKHSLNEKLVQLTERYEEKLKEQDIRNAEKLKLLEEEISEKQAEIHDFEMEIAKYEKEKHNSFGNIALGSITARAMEHFAKSDIGVGVLKGLLGAEGYSTLQGHLAGIENEKNNTNEQPSARIVSEPETNNNDPRSVAIKFINEVANNLPDMYLRMLYDLVEMSGRNIQDLQVLWKVAEQIKQQRTSGKKTEGQKERSDKPEENKSDNSEDQLENIP
jgi:hypothetical protein